MTWKKSNEHMVPQLILDLGTRMNKTDNVNESNNIRIRLEIIKEYCEFILNKKVK